MTMLTETAVVDTIAVRESGQIEIRTVHAISRDGAEIARTYHREVLLPGSDLAGRDERLVAIAATVWTPEVVVAYKATIPEEVDNA